MNNNNVEVSLTPTEEGFAYDVRITHESATLGQYIAALDDFLEAKVAPCLGCDNCCYQRIPLILPDIYAIAGADSAVVGDFIARRAALSRCGPAVDIRLAQGEDGICTFLDGENQRCLDHPHRTMVCHTYICLPQTPRARELRETLINQGEDALVAELFHWGLLDHWRELAVNYPRQKAWVNKTYWEVILQEVLPSELWAALTNPH